MCDIFFVVIIFFLIYIFCGELYDEVFKICDWLCVVGMYGDFGNIFKWELLFSDMILVFKVYIKKILNEVVFLINVF